ncbi:MAG: methyltransferase [Pseudomonadota bacterium]
MFDGQDANAPAALATADLAYSPAALSAKDRPARSAGADQTPSGRRLFFANWLRHPLRTAAQAPSGKALAREMARAAMAGRRPGPVVEFGVGTGSITDSLLAYGVDQRDLVLVEQNPEFCAFLSRRYPQATLIEGDAFDAIRRLRGVAAQAVLSGLPLVQFPRASRLRFIHDCLDGVLASGGRVAQFTYGCRSPAPLTGGPRLRAHCSRRIWLNLWPACVWTYQRASEA